MTGRSPSPLLNQIFESVIRITSQSDVVALEQTLFEELAKLIPYINEISLYKILQDHDVERSVHLVARQDNGAESGYELREETDILTATGDLEQCIARAAPVSVCLDDGTCNTFLPVLNERELVGVIAINSRQRLASSVKLLSGLLQIYQNHSSVLIQSERDKLTGLLNRRNFELRLVRLLAIQRAKQAQAIDTRNPTEKRLLHADAQAWLAAIDIDHFKHVNDRYGHAHGDEVLLRFSRRMRESFRKADLLFRFGGEEFIVVLEPVPGQLACDVLERFRRQVSACEFPLIGHITISIGFARIGENDYPPTVLERADKALYFAKAHGRNCIYGYEELLAEHLIGLPLVSQDAELF